MTVEDRSSEESGQPHPSRSLWMPRLIWGFQLIAWIGVIAMFSSNINNRIDIVNMSDLPISIVSVDLELSQNRSKRLVSDRVVAAADRLTIPFAFRSGATKFSVHYRIGEKSCSIAIVPLPDQLEDSPILVIDSTACPNGWSFRKLNGLVYKLRRLCPW